MVGSVTSGQMVLGSTRKRAEQARGTSQGNKPGEQASEQHSSEASASAPPPGFCCELLL